MLKDKPKMTFWPPNRSASSEPSLALDHTEKVSAICNLSLLPSLFLLFHSPPPSSHALPFPFFYQWWVSNTWGFYNLPAFFLPHSLLAFCLSPSSLCKISLPVSTHFVCKNTEFRPSVNIWAVKKYWSHIKFPLLCQPWKSRCFLFCAFPLTFSGLNMKISSASKNQHIFPFTRKHIQTTKVELFPKSSRDI